MQSNNLLAFHGEAAKKELCISQVRVWLQNKMLPRDPYEIAREIFNPIKSYKPSACILENYDLYPSKLGLPRWLANLFSTIEHHNAKEFYGTGRNFEHYFYESFLAACNVGVDYTQMFHKWELFLLTNQLPENEKEQKAIQSVVELHQQALSGVKVSGEQWNKVSHELESIMNGIDEFSGVTKEMIKKEIDALEYLNSIQGTGNRSYADKHKEFYHLQAVRKAIGQVTWDSCRAAYLSSQEALDVEDCWTSSVEAIVEARWQEALLTGAGTADNKLEFQQNTWYELMDGLLIMLREWH